MAEAFKPDYAKLNEAEYLECLYVIVKHASFTAVARERLLPPLVNPYRDAVPPQAIEVVRQ